MISFTARDIPSTLRHPRDENGRAPFKWAQCQLSTIADPHNRTAGLRLLACVAPRRAVARIHDSRRDGAARWSLAGPWRFTVQIILPRVVTDATNITKQAVSCLCIIIFFSRVVNHCIACLVSSIFLTSYGFMLSFSPPGLPIIQKNLAHRMLITQPSFNLVVQEVDPIFQPASPPENLSHLGARHLADRRLLDK